MQICEARAAAREAERGLLRAESKATKVEIRVRDLETAERELKHQLQQERDQRSSSGGGCFSLGGCLTSPLAKP
jgi:hypothetical protein